MIKASQKCGAFAYAYSDVRGIAQLMFKEKFLMKTAYFDLCIAKAG